MGHIININIIIIISSLLKLCLYAFTRILSSFKLWSLISPERNIISAIRKWRYVRNYDVGLFYRVTQGLCGACSAGEVLESRSKAIKVTASPKCKKACSELAIFISANGTKWIGGDYEIGRSVRLCVRLSVCVHEYTTGRNGGLWRLLHWRRYALWRAPSSFKHLDRFVMFLIVFYCCCAMLTECVAVFLRFLADHTNDGAYSTVCRPSVCRLSVTFFFWWSLFKLAFHWACADLVWSACQSTPLTSCFSRDCDTLVLYTSPSFLPRGKSRSDLHRRQWRSSDVICLT